jgi:hypothetical protein
MDVPGCEVSPDGHLMAQVELPDGRKVKTAVGEVSAAVRDWRDGSGKLWKDSIVHVAITPMPVVAGQGGFTAAELNLAGDDSGTTYLSLSGLLYTLGENDMADENEMEGGEAGSNKCFEDCKMGLEAHGIHLPPDTNKENFCEHLAIALHAIKGATGQLEAEEEPEEELEGEPEPGEEGEEGATYSGEDEEQAQQEPRPVMMSLDTVHDPITRGLFKRAAADHKNKQLRALASLQKRGLPPHRADKLRAQIEGYKLSLDRSGEVVQKKVDHELSLLDEVLPAPRGKNGKVPIRTARRVERPGAGAEADSPEEIAARAARVSKVR